MIEMTIKLDETLVKTFGKQTLELQIQEFVQKLLVKMAAQDILQDLPSTNLANDPKWQLARTTAWEEKKEKFQVYLDEARKKASPQK